MTSHVFLLVFLLSQAKRIESQDSTEAEITAWYDSVFEQQLNSLRNDTNVQSVIANIRHHTGSKGVGLITCYGLGRFITSNFSIELFGSGPQPRGMENSRIGQHAFCELLRESFNVKPADVWITDPRYRELEIKLVTRTGYSYEYLQYCQRPVSKRNTYSVFYMPYLPFDLTEYVIEANWNHLSKLILIGNEIDTELQRSYSRLFKLPHCFEAIQYAVEEGIALAQDWPQELFWLARSCYFFRQPANMPDLETVRKAIAEKDPEVNEAYIRNQKLWPTEEDRRRAREILFENEATKQQEDIEDDLMACQASGSGEERPELMSRESRWRRRADHDRQRMRRCRRLARLNRGVPRVRQESPEQQYRRQRLRQAAARLLRMVPGHEQLKRQ